MTRPRWTRSDRESLPLVVYSHLLGGIILLLEGTFSEARTVMDVVGLLFVAPLTFPRFGIVGVIALVLLAGLLTGISYKSIGWPHLSPRHRPGVRIQAGREP